MGRKVATDDQNAFELVRGRLVGDVGGILNRAGRPGENFTPFWALCRCLFPVAEAIADLLHHDKNEGTAKRLTRFLSADLEGIRTGYERLAATLTVLYRHALTHTDEMRVLITGGRTVNWSIFFGNPAGVAPHLAIEKLDASNYRVNFNASDFYGDLVVFLDKAKAKTTWGGKVMGRYNSWLELDLDLQASPTATEQQAINEIAKF
jgi:hypothetical protein